MSFKAKIPSFREINYQQTPRACFCVESGQAGAIAQFSHRRLLGAMGVQPSAPADGGGRVVSNSRCLVFSGAFHCGHTVAMCPVACSLAEPNCTFMLRSAGSFT